MKTQQILAKLEQVLNEVKELQEAPREIVRGENGRPAGVQVGGKFRKIKRGADGNRDSMKVSKAKTLPSALGNIFDFST